MAKTTKVTTRTDGRNIQFINQDIESAGVLNKETGKKEGVVNIRIRGHQMFIESETGLIRVGSSLVKNRETGEPVMDAETGLQKIRLYAHIIDKREENAQRPKAML